MDISVDNKDLQIFKHHVLNLPEENKYNNYINFSINYIALYKLLVQFNFFPTVLNDLIFEYINDNVVVEYKLVYGIIMGVIFKIPITINYKSYVAHLTINIRNNQYIIVHTSKHVLCQLIDNKSPSTKLEDYLNKNIDMLGITNAYEKYINNENFKIVDYYKNININICRCCNFSQTFDYHDKCNLHYILNNGYEMINEDTVKYDNKKYKIMDHDIFKTIHFIYKTLVNNLIYPST